MIFAARLREDARSKNKIESPVEKRGERVTLNLYIIGTRSITDTLEIVKKRELVSFHRGGVHKNVLLHTAMWKNTIYFYMRYRNVTFIYIKKSYIPYSVSTVTRFHCIENITQRICMQLKLCRLIETKSWRFIAYTLKDGHERKRIQARSWEFYNFMRQLDEQLRFLHIIRAVKIWRTKRI